MDLYEEADKNEQQAKLVNPEPAKRNPKAFIAGGVAVGLILMAIILSHIAGLVTSKTSNTASAETPQTMSKQDSDNFAMQQRAQGQFLKNLDRDNKNRANVDAVLGDAKGLAADALAEVDGIPPKTKAQDDAEHGRTMNGIGMSEAQQQAEKARLEAEHRRQNDLDSSPVSIDYSDFFAKEKEASQQTAAAEATAPASAAAPVTATIAPSTKGEADNPEFKTTLNTIQPHNPSDDYVFDSSFGKLYRLMENTIIETVLVNRLAGAAVGPIITMVTTDVYSHSGAHLLIPKGTRLLGNVTAVGSVNQERLFVAFHRMIMPDGYSVSLDKFKGLDVVGQTGLRDQVNHHYLQIFGSSLALAAIAATTQIGSNLSFGAYNWGVAMRMNAAQSLGESAQRVMERFLNVLPTFTIRERSRVKVMLSNDLLLPDIKNHTMDPDL